VKGEANAVRALFDGLALVPAVDRFGPTASATGMQGLLRADDTEELADALAATAPAARAEGRLRIAVDPLRV
jgi:hypothetical protein